MIQDLEEVMCRHLNHFRKMTGGRLPLRIMYYRDGVSEGQFNAVSEFVRIRFSQRSEYILHWCS